MKFKLLKCKCHKVSDNGTLWSCIKQFSQKGKQGIQTSKKGKWKKISGTMTKKGYLQTNVHGKIWRMNRLIAINFIPNPSNYPEVQHKNDIKVDNRIVNLKWGNQKENAKDRNKNGNTLKGEDSPNVKLNNKKVKEIRKKLKIGRSLISLANEYKVSKKLILLLKQNKIWKHLKQN